MDALSRRAYGGAAIFAAALALLIFGSAWTIRYPEAWIYCIVFSTCVLIITRYFLEHDPALIARRLDAGPAAERERAQQRIQSAASVLLCAMFVSAGFERRLAPWSAIPVWTPFAADLAVVAGFAVVFLACRDNSHASAIVTVESGQRVVSSGAYGVVRHPMYAGALVLFLATPMALASRWALLPAAGLCATLVIRLIAEERYLERHLAEYGEYERRVRFRLVPGIW